MKNKIIAITGGIGSGKSTLSKIIKNLGYTVFSADEIYKELIKEEIFVKEIYEALDIKTDSLIFDKNLISSKVFSNKEMLKKLNAVTHPKIVEKMLFESKKHEGFVFNEVPLLYEGGFENLYDKIIVVVRDLQKRISSIEKRDGLNKEDIILRIKNQHNYEKITKNEHTFIISNDSSEEELANNIKVIIESIKNEK